MLITDIVCWKHYNIAVRNEQCISVPWNCIHMLPARNCKLLLHNSNTCTVSCHCAIDTGWEAATMDDIYVYRYPKFYRVARKRDLLSRHLHSIERSTQQQKNYSIANYPFFPYQRFSRVFFKQVVLQVCAVLMQF